MQNTTRRKSQRLRSKSQETPFIFDLADFLTQEVRFFTFWAKTLFIAK